MTNHNAIQTATDAFTPNAQRSILNGNRLTGAMLMIVPLIFTLVFTLLGTSFEYPDILRKPVVYVLERFAAGGSGLVAMWYGMFASALIFTAIPTLTRKVFPEQNLSLDLGVTFGVLAGLVQALGFARWVFLVPSLAATNADPSSSEATRAAVSVVFDAFNRYAGIGLGEHLGYLFTALWTFSIAIALLQRSRLLAITGAIFAVGILAGLLEPAGFAWAGTVNAMAYLAWSVWMIAFGLTIWRAAKPAMSNR